MKRKEAFIFWNGGVCSVIDSKSRKTVTTSPSGNIRSAVQRAKSKGYRVRKHNGGWF